MTELTPLQTIAAEESLNFGLNPALGMALAHWESGGMNPTAVSPTGVTGLFQVTNKTGAPYGQTPATRTDPRVSAHAGLGYFKDLLDLHHGDVREALTSYNGRGPGRDPQFAERVLSVYPQYAQYETLSRGQPIQPHATQGGGMDLDALDAQLKATWQQRPPGAGGAPPAAGAAVDLDALDAQLTQTWQQTPPSAPPAAAPPVQTTPENLTPIDVGKELGISTKTFPDLAREAGALGVRGGLTAGGALLGSLASPVVGTTAGAIVGGLAANRANVALGLEPPEKPLVSVGGFPVTLGDTLAVAAPLVTAMPGALRQYLTTSPAGKALSTAETATEAARQTWQTAADKALALQGKEQTSLYQAAWKEAKDAQAEYRASLKDYDTAVQAAQTHDQAVQVQGQALQTAKSLPTQYAPATPSWTLYEKFHDVAKTAPVDMEPVKAAVKSLVAERGVTPTGEALPLPHAVQAFVDSASAAANTVDVGTVQQQLRALGPLTRSPNGAIRGVAKQLYGAYTDTLEQTAQQIPETKGARDLLLQANKNFRQEMAVQDLGEMLIPGKGVVKVDNMGRETINVGALLTRLEKHIQTDSFFAKSFSPSDLQQLRADFYGLKGTPAMPTGARPLVPGAPTPPEQLPGAAPWARQPGAPLAPPPAAVEPTLGPRPSMSLSLKTLIEALGLGVGVNWKVGVATGSAAIAGPQLSYLVAKGLLTPSVRPLLLDVLKSGPIPPALQGVLATALAQGARHQERQAGQLSPGAP